MFTSFIKTQNLATSKRLHPDRLLRLLKTAKTRLKSPIIPRITQPPRLIKTLLNNSLINIIKLLPKISHIRSRLPFTHKIRHSKI